MKSLRTGSEVAERERNERKQRTTTIIEKLGNFIVCKFVVLDLRDDDRIYIKFIALIGTVHVILVTEEKEKKRKRKAILNVIQSCTSLLFVWLVQELPILFVNNG